MKVWTSLSEREIYDVAATVGVAIAVQQSSTEGRHVEIPKIGHAYSFGLRPLRSTRDADGNYRYQRTSASIMFHEGRRVFAVCWHGYRDFMMELYHRDPNARIKTWVADYKDRDNFYSNYQATGWRNVGAPIAPVSLDSVCTCRE